MSERRNMGLIRECVSWANQDGFPLTEYGLRLLIKQGKVPTRRIGAKYLIYYPNLQRFLTCEDGQDNPVPTTTTERRFFHA